MAASQGVGRGLQPGVSRFFDPLDPLALQGTYFLVADIRPLAGRGSRKQQSVAGQGSDTGSSANGSAAPNGTPAHGAGVAAAGRGATETDVDFCQRLTVEAGVTLIPVRKI